MRLLLQLAARQLIYRPARTLLSALGIAMGIATVVAVLVVDDNTLLSQQARRAPDDPGADLLIQPLDSKPAAASVAEDRLRAQPFLRGVTAFATGRRSLVVTPPADAAPGSRPRPLPDIEVMALEPGAMTHHEAYTVAEGGDLDPAGGEPQMLISAAIAQQLSLKPGDLVALFAPPARRGPMTKCIDGELVRVPPPSRPPSGEPERSPFRVAGILAPTHLGFAKNRVLVDFDQGRALFGDDFQVSYWADLDRAQADFLGAEAALRRDFTVFEPKRALAGLDPAEAAFRSGVRLCGFLALFLGLYIIFNTMSMSLVERVRQIGLLRALGLTRGQLFLVFLVEGLVLALLGAALSVLLANWIVQAMVSLRITTLGFGQPLEIVQIPWGPVAAVMGAGVAFALLGIVYPFLRASSLSVIDALRRGVIALSDDPFTGTRRTLLLGLLLLVPLAWFIGAPADGGLAEPLWRAFLEASGIVIVALAVPLLLPQLLPALSRALLAPLRGPAAALARATLSSARHRVFATVSGLMLVFAAVFVVVSLLESLKSDSRAFQRRALDGHVYLRITPDVVDLLPDLEQQVPALGSLTPINVQIHNPFLIRALPEQLLSTGSLSGDAERLAAFVAGPTLILSTRCAEDFGYLTGDRIRLATAAEGAVDFEVLAVSDEYGYAPDDRVFALVSAPMMKRYWCLDGEGLGGFFVSSPSGLPPSGIGPVRAQVERVLGQENVLELRSGEQIGAGYLADLDRDFAIFYAILLLTILLATLGVLNAMVISVMERRREIGLLRAVGLTGGQVARMLLLESGAFGVLGGLLGLLVGWPLSVAAVRALATTSSMDIAFDWTPRALVTVLAGSVFVVVLAVLYPALRANRLKLSEVMRYE
jgi:putative ABC transport system permease protein